jgi:hypothetical protein
MADSNHAQNSYTWTQGAVVGWNPFEVVRAFRAWGPMMHERDLDRQEAESDTGLLGSGWRSLYHAAHGYSAGHSCDRDHDHPDEHGDGREHLHARAAHRVD